GQSSTGDVEVLRNDEDAVHASLAHDPGGAPGTRKRRDPAPIEDDARGRKATRHEVVAHDDRLVVALAAQASAHDDRREVPGAIELEGSVEAGAKPGRRRAVELHRVAEDQCDVRLAQIVTKAGDDEQGCSEKEDTEPAAEDEEVLPGQAVPPSILDSPK